jgi:hypothetical protein
MKVNFCAYKYPNISNSENWEKIYNITIQAFIDLGHEVYLSPHLYLKNKPEKAKTGICDDNAIHVYNHTYTKDIRVKGWKRSQSKLDIFLKPTGPSIDYFTLDTIGYAGFSSPAYKTDYDVYPPVLLDELYENEVKSLVEKASNKWYAPHLQFTPVEIDIPDNHILIIGQMPGDVTVNDFSFGNHWTKLEQIIEALVNEKTEWPIVVKLHPSLKMETKNTGAWKDFLPYVERWRKWGIIVVENFENIYTILNKSRVAIIENSTSGIEALMQDVPIISYGTPEYVWATKELKHLAPLYDYISDLSWYNKNKSRSWLYWFMNKYACKDLESTTKRLEEILAE